MGTGIEMGTGTGHASPRPAMPFPSKQCTTRANPISLCPSTKHGLEENPGKELVSLTALIPSAHPLQASCRWGPAPPITLLLPLGTWLSLMCVPPISHVPGFWPLCRVNLTATPTNLLKSDRKVWEQYLFFSTAEEKMLICGHFPFRSIQHKCIVPL